MGELSVVIPKGLLDSKPDVSVLIGLGEYYAARGLPASGLDSDLVFESPRNQLMVRTLVKGSAIGAHWHSVTDELVIVMGGRGEMLINSEWRPVERGSVHACPRGIIHDTRALTENLQYLSVFAPHLPPGGDLNFVK